MRQVKRRRDMFALKYHPDKNPGDMGAADRFRKVQNAYELLEKEHSKMRAQKQMRT